MKTIIVTGGCGYIGSHTIVELLQHTDWNIISLDNFANSSPDVVERIIQAGGREFVNYECDISDQAALREAASKFGACDGIIHFAAHKAVGESVAEPMKYYRNNLDGLLNMLDLAQDAGTKTFVFSSSCSVYGNPDTLPVTEATPLAKAESPYAYTKVVGERVVTDVASVTSLSAVLLRYFNPVGAHKSGLIGEDPRNAPSNLVPVIVDAALGRRDPVTVFGDDYDTRDGTCVRDYVHVSDVARAHVDALRYAFENDNTVSVFNLGSGTGSTVKEVIETFESVTDTKVPHSYGPRRPGDVVAVYADNTKAEAELGWKPKYDLATMLETAWKWGSKA